MSRIELVPSRWVGEGERSFVIAEAGVNHNGDPELALRLIEVAADAGADAVKFQTFRAETLASPSARKAAYQAAATGGEESQAAMLQRLELSPQVHQRLIERCRELDLVFLSTPFDLRSLEFLDRLQVPALKLGSGEVTHHRLIQAAAATGRPLILSTGMATLDEIGAAVGVFNAAGGRALVLLHCVSAYPAPAEQVNLRAISTLAQAFGVPVGFSDHTVGTDVAIGAAALGAAVIEKHFTLDRGLPGPDHAASLEPSELKQMVEGIRRVSVALGDGVKRPMPCELDTLEVARRSLAAARDLPVGVELQPSDLIGLRPATGICPSQESSVVGRRLGRAVQAGQLLRLEDLE